MSLKFGFTDPSGAAVTWRLYNNYLGETPSSRHANFSTNGHITNWGTHFKNEPIVQAGIQGLAFNQYTSDHNIASHELSPYINDPLHNIGMLNNEGVNPNPLAGSNHLTNALISPGGNPMTWSALSDIDMYYRILGNPYRPGDPLSPQYALAMHARLEGDTFMNPESTKTGVQRPQRPRDYVHPRNLASRGINAAHAREDAALPPVGTGPTVQAADAVRSGEVYIMPPRVLPSTSDIGPQTSNLPGNDDTIGTEGSTDDGSGGDGGIDPPAVNNETFTPSNGDAMEEELHIIADIIDGSSGPFSNSLRRVEDSAHHPNNRHIVTILKREAEDYLDVIRKKYRLDEDATEDIHTPGEGSQYTGLPFSSGSKKKKMSIKNLRKSAVVDDETERLAKQMLIQEQKKKSARDEFNRWARKQREKPYDQSIISEQNVDVNSYNWPKSSRPGPFGLGGDLSEEDYMAISARLKHLQKAEPEIEADHVMAQSNTSTGNSRAYEAAQTLLDAIPDPYVNETPFSRDINEFQKTSVDPVEEAFNPQMTAAPYWESMFKDPEEVYQNNINSSKDSYLALTPKKIASNAEKQAQNSVNVTQAGNAANAAYQVAIMQNVFGKRYQKILTMRTNEKREQELMGGEDPYSDLTPAHLPPKPVGQPKKKKGKN